MSKGPPAARLVALALLLSVPWVGLPPRAEPATGSVSGRILSGETRDPLVGAVVRLADARSGQLFSSPATDVAGNFSVAGLRPSVYRLAVQTGEGLFTSRTPLAVESSEDRHVQVAVYRAQDDPGSPGNDDEDDLGAWDNPLTATGIVLGAAVVVGYVVDQATEDSTTGSPSSP